MERHMSSLKLLHVTLLKLHLCAIIHCRDCIKHLLTTHWQFCNADDEESLPLPFRTCLCAEPIHSCTTSGSPSWKYPCLQTRAKGCRKSKEDKVYMHTLINHPSAHREQAVSFHSSADIGLHTLWCALFAHFARAKVFGTSSLSM